MIFNISEHKSYRIILNFFYFMDNKNEINFNFLRPFGCVTISSGSFTASYETKIHKYPLLQVNLRKLKKVSVCKDGSLKFTKPKRMYFSASTKIDIYIYLFMIRIRTLVEKKKFPQEKGFFI